MALMTTVLEKTFLIQIYKEEVISRIGKKTPPHKKQIIKTTITIFFLLKKTKDFQQSVLHT